MRGSGSKRESGLSPAHKWTYIRLRICTMAQVITGSGKVAVVIGSGAVGAFAAIKLAEQGWIVKVSYCAHPPRVKAVKFGAADTRPRCAALFAAYAH